MAYSLGILGWHVERSLSPRLHAAALRSLGLVGEYRIYPVEPGRSAAVEIRRLVTTVREGDLRGLNITMPFKEAVLDWVDSLTEEARAIGAVNTLYRCSGSVIGDNTDAKGFLTDLYSQVQRRRGRALILGAGGAARAVAHALAIDGWRVLVASRRVDKAQRLAAHIGRGRSPRVEPLPLDSGSLGHVCADLELLVNATPVGSAWGEEGVPWPSGLDLPPHAIVYDLVYDPRETVLMKMARQAGLQTMGGVGMLVEQAALAFELWTGREAPREAMMAATLDDSFALTSEG